MLTINPFRKLEKGLILLMPDINNNNLWISELGETQWIIKEVMGTVEILCSQIASRSLNLDFVLHICVLYYVFCALKDCAPRTDVDHIYAAKTLFFFLVYWSILFSVFLKVSLHTFSCADNSVWQRHLHDKGKMKTSIFRKGNSMPIVKLCAAIEFQYTSSSYSYMIDIWH